jgi:hypothetical protein
MGIGPRSVLMISILGPAVKLVALPVQELHDRDGVCAAVHGVVRLTDQGGDLQPGCEVERVRGRDGKTAVRGDEIE